MTDYQEYLLDYMKEFRSKELQYMNQSIFDEVEPIEEDAEGKLPAYKENYLFRDKLQLPKITPELAKLKVREEIIAFTGNYMDTHSKQLSTSGPVYMITFSAKETSFLYTLFNTSAEEIIDLYKEVDKETYFGKISKFFTGWVMNAPHKILITSILIDALQNGYDDIRECMEYLWAFTEYPIILRKYWPIGVKEDVMNYTIEHLGSKFKITKTKNLQEFLKYDSWMAVKSMESRLKTGADNTYMDLMYSIRNRFNSSFKNIAREYKKNSDLNRTQHTDASVLDDGTISDQGGMVANVSQIIDSIVTKFSNGEINAAMVKIAAESVEVDRSNLQGFLAQIYSTKDNQIPQFIEAIVMEYFQRNPSEQQIEARSFLNFGLSLYRSIGTSKDSNLVKIRKAVNHWMNDIIHIGDYYNREATKISYTRAVYNYFILQLNYYN